MSTPGLTLRTVPVGPENVPYLSGFGRTRALGEELLKRLTGHTALFVLVDRRARDHALPLLDQLGGDMPVIPVFLDVSEREKGLHVVWDLLEQGVAGGVDRGSAVLAMGGGVLGNLAGMVAALLYRGLPLVHLPTTPVSAFDAVLSAKQAVNLAQGKNLCGTFLTPALIACDLAWLTTIPDHHLGTGAAEMVKNVLAVLPDRAPDLLGALAALRTAPEEALPALLDIGIAAKAPFLATDPWEKQDALVFEYVIGSDLAGVVLRTGPGVNLWHPGDEVVAHCLSVELESAEGHNDSMLDPEQRIWGFETNFGGLAELSLVKSNQLMPKPRHLTWEEAAASGLVNSTAYRQLVSVNGANLKQGDNVLIWGASGGLGSYATQLVLAGGANPVCVVSSPARAELCQRMGAEAVIDRAAEGYRFWRDEHTQDPGEWRRFGARIRELTGDEDVDIVLEHPGRETFGASVYVARKGGTIVTCASTSGYQHHYDNRYLWMSLKRIVGSHFANYREAWEANRLIAKGRVHPTLSRTYPLAETGQAAHDVYANVHQGKVGVLTLAPEEGLGVSDPEMRARHVDAINVFRRPRPVGK